MRTPQALLCWLGVTALTYRNLPGIGLEAIGKLAQRYWLAERVLRSDMRGYRMLNSITLAATDFNAAVDMLPLLFSIAAVILTITIFE